MISSRLVAEGSRREPAGSFAGLNGPLESGKPSPADDRGNAAPKVQQTTLLSRLELYEREAGRTTDSPETIAWIREVGGRMLRHL